MFIKEVEEGHRTLREQDRRLYTAGDVLVQLVKQSDLHFATRYIRDTFGLSALEPHIERYRKNIGANLTTAREIGLEKMFPEPVHMSRSKGVVLEINVPTFLQHLREQFPEPEKPTPGVSV